MLLLFRFDLVMEKRSEEILNRHGICLDMISMKEFARKSCLPTAKLKIEVGKTVFKSFSLVAEWSKLSRDCKK